eukprot:TRINITY_DN63066_c0_g1_i1.p1 TRINITY_DN63066_c0_g1~~TRINITY_DN63066_c0_g1_i1.p1  ORF type:complete len:285 (+),score=24.68 TRINITY_DN63066_c0_g1_i1:99-953(+)
MIMNNQQAVISFLLLCHLSTLVDAQFRVVVKTGSRLSSGTTDPMKVSLWVPIDNNRDTRILEGTAHCGDADSPSGCDLNLGPCSHDTYIVFGASGPHLPDELTDEKTNSEVATGLSDPLTGWHCGTNPSNPTTPDCRDSIPYQVALHKGGLDGLCVEWIAVQQWGGDMWADLWDWRPTGIEDERPCLSGEGWANSGTPECPMQYSNGCVWMNKESFDDFHTLIITRTQTEKPVFGSKGLRTTTTTHWMVQAVRNVSPPKTYRFGGNPATDPWFGSLNNAIQHNE